MRMPICIEGSHFFWNYVDLPSKPFEFHLPLIRVISPTDIIEVLRDFEAPHACDSETSSILFGWHKSAGHSSLVHSGLGSHREDSGAERAAASHWTLMFCPQVLVPHNQSHEISS